MSGLNSSGGVQRRVTGFAGVPGVRGDVAGLVLGLGGDFVTGLGTGGGCPWMHWDLGRSHKSQ
jgi:hypothetical protein